jgi:mRNA interferase HigB
MRIVGRDDLQKFRAKHPDCRGWITNWLADTERASWRVSQDIKDRYVTASFLADNIVVFNVRGNEYRLVTRVVYRSNLVVILWIGKHADYDKKYS